MAQNPLKVLSDLYVREQSQLSKGIAVSGALSGTTGLYVKKDAVIDGQLTVGGTVTNNGYAQAGALQVDGILDVAGNGYISGTLEVTGNLNVSGTIYSTNVTFDSQYITKDLTVGFHKALVVKENAISGNNPSNPYAYAGQKMYVKTSGSVASGSFLSGSTLDLSSVDSTMPANTNVIDVEASFKSLDDFIARLNEIIEF